MGKRLVGSIRRAVAGWAGRTAQRYRVEIPYSEPMFALETGRLPGHLYVGDFEVEARDDAEAVARGLSSFEGLRERSDVSYARVPHLDKIRVSALGRREG